MPLRPHSPDPFVLDKMRQNTRCQNALRPMEPPAGYDCQASAQRRPNNWVRSNPCSNPSCQHPPNTIVNAHLPDLKETQTRLAKIGLNSPKPFKYLLWRHTSILFSCLLILEVQEPLGKL